MTNKELAELGNLRKEHAYNLAYMLKLKEEYHWSNCRIDHFFDKFERVVKSYNDNIPRSAKQNEEHAIAMAKEFERKYDFAIDPMFEEARRFLDGEEVSDGDN